MSEPFLAEIRIFAGNFAPRPWAFCDGQLLQIAQNTALFSLTGTTYGGDGRTTFGLPNLQDRAPMHPGRGPGLTSRRLGERIGADTATVTEAQMPSHTHNYMLSSAMADEEGTSDPAGATPGVPRRSQRHLATPNNLEVLSGMTDAGGGAAHNNMQPYLGLNYIIALAGTYPSR